MPLCMRTDPGDLGSQSTFPSGPERDAEAGPPHLTSSTPPSPFSLASPSACTHCGTPPAPSLPGRPQPCPVPFQVAHTAAHSLQGLASARWRYSGSPGRLCSPRGGGRGSSQVHKPSSQAWGQQAGRRRGSPGGRCREGGLARSPGVAQVGRLCAQGREGTGGSDVASADRPQLPSGCPPPTRCRPRLPAGCPSPPPPQASARLGISTLTLGPATLGFWFVC